MRGVFLLIVFIFISPYYLFGQINNIKTEQLKSERFSKVYKKKEKEVAELLKLNKLDIQSLKVFIRVFKNEDTLEVWAKDKNRTKYKLFKTYQICEKSGILGPKRREGDGQVPEGFYNIQGFNPDGKYYLTLWINYPNASDNILSDKKRPGSEICIHGKCVTIGCIPMTDPQIEEIYTLCIEAASNGQNIIQTHIFPSRLNQINLNLLKKEYANNRSLVEFWQNLKTGYDFFETNKTLPKISVNSQGKYLFK